MKDISDDKQKVVAQSFKSFQMSKEQIQKINEHAMNALLSLKQEMKQDMNNSLHQPNSLYHKSVEMINAGIDMMNFLNSPGPKSLDNTKNCLKTTNGDEGQDDSCDYDNGQSAIVDHQAQTLENVQAFNVEMSNKIIAHMQNRQKLNSNIQKEVASFRFLHQNLVKIKNYNLEVLLYDYVMRSNIPLLLGNLKMFKLKIEKWLETSIQIAKMSVIKSLNHILDVFKEALDICDQQLPNLKNFTDEWNRINIQIINASSGFPNSSGQLKLPSEDQKRQRIKLLESKQLQVLKAILIKLECLPQIDLDIEQSVMDTKLQKSSHGLQIKDKQ